MKRATPHTIFYIIFYFDFNPHPLWRGRLGITTSQQMLLSISIHTLCEEGDVFSASAFWQLSNFNPHPLWRGRRRCFIICVLVNIFQSTPSVKRATIYYSFLCFWVSISIHTLCEEGDRYNYQKYRKQVNFNPHPLWRGRLWYSNMHKKINEFQSTPSVKRATGLTLLTFFPKKISIHTLCE